MTWHPFPSAVVAELATVAQQHLVMALDRRTRGALAEPERASALHRAL